MSEEPQSPDSASEAPKKARRAAATPRPRKTAKKAAAKAAAPVESAPAAAPAPEASAPAPVVRQEPVEHEREERPVISESRSIPRDPRLDDISGHESHDQGGSKSGWPEPETIQGGSEGSGGSGKRKRRRKKKGGQGGQGGQPSHGGHASQEHHQSPRPQQAPAQAPAGEAAHARPQPAPQQQPQPQAPRVPVDPEELAKKAWRIFLGEVGEEGLALIGDQDAREISRRSFRLAEIFLEEQGRRTR